MDCPSASRSISASHVMFLVHIVRSWYGLFVTSTVACLHSKVMLGVLRPPCRRPSVNFKCVRGAVPDRPLLAWRVVRLVQVRPSPFVGALRLFSIAPSCLQFYRRADVRPYTFPVFVRGVPRTCTMSRCARRLKVYWRADRRPHTGPVFGRAAPRACMMDRVCGNRVPRWS